MLGLNVCDREIREQCFKSYKGKIAEFKKQCKTCEKKTGRQIGEWTQHILRLRRLALAGYPFEKDDLSYEEWIDLGVANELLNNK